MKPKNVRDALYSPLRFGQFISVGAIGAVCDNTVLLTLATLGVLPELAKFVGIEVAIIIMFLLNEHWTFANEGAAGVPALLRRLVTSNLVRLGGITVQLIVFSLVYRWFHVSLTLWGLDLWLLVASVSGILAGMIVNYITESLVTWRVHRH